MKFSRQLKGLFASVVLGFVAGAQASPIQVDFVFIVDESVGMPENLQDNLRNHIALFDAILSNSGQVSALYGLIGYGNIQQAPRMLTDLANAAGFATAAQGLVSNGAIEPGYAATAFALNALDNQGDQFSFRANAVKNIIIFTDEPSNGDGNFLAGQPRYTVGGVQLSSSTTDPNGRPLIDQLLKDNNALFNAVLSGASTIDSYGALATGNFGQVFDLALFNTTDPQEIGAVFTVLAQVKLGEIREFCAINSGLPQCNPVAVSEPGILLLFALGLSQMGMARLRRARVTVTRSGTRRQPVS